MLAIVDYGVGNLFSLKSSFSAIGVEAVVSGEAAVIERADRIVLPGVGAFGDAAQKLRDCGMDRAVIAAAQAGKPLLGICLGMQLLFDMGYEYGEHSGLGLIHGEVRFIGEAIPAELKIPHMGWNALNMRMPKSRLFKYVEPGDHVYFVHSYYGANCAEDTIATAEYGAELTAAVERGNVFGCQFHPEKSGAVGLNILRGFMELEV